MITKRFSSALNHQGLPIVLQQLSALTVLILLSPFLILLMIAIQVESKGGCFYAQTRVGQFGRYFKMYKFRSMYLVSDPRYQEPVAQASDRMGVCQKFKEDPRVTKIGKFIRKYSIDEIPQLWNVVTGDMLLIGPRPALVSEVEQYPLAALSRLHAIPGLSGLWQVSGRADTDFDTQVGLDITYINKQSLWLDIKIIFATIPCVLFAKGAY